jgi:hypothetical protein
LYSCTFQYAPFLCGLYPYIFTNLAIFVTYWYIFYFTTIFLDTCTHFLNCTRTLSNPQQLFTDCTGTYSIRACFFQRSNLLKHFGLSTSISLSLNYLFPFQNFSSLLQTIKLLLLHPSPNLTTNRAPSLLPVSNITEQGTFNSSLADNSNRVIAPDYHSRSRVFTLQSGGDLDNHPQGEKVLLCREHLTRLSDIIDNWEFISNNIHQDSPSDKLHTYIQTALS